MAIRLGPWVEQGELQNEKRNSVIGWFKLTGRDELLRVELVGNLTGELAGNLIKFSGATPVVGHLEAEPDFDFEKLEWNQFGPTGEIVIRQVRVFDCSVEEMSRRRKAKLPVREEWKPCLYVEWFGPNGRMVMELVDPAYEILPGNFRDPDDELADDLSEPEFLDSDPLLDLESSGLPPSPLDTLLDEALDDAAANVNDPDEADDPYGLFPPEFDKQLSESNPDSADAEANSLPPNFVTEVHLDEETRQRWELWDEITQGKNEVPIGELIDPPIHLRRPDALSETEAEIEFKSLLAVLALHNVAIAVCPHLTWRDAYIMTLDQILPEIFVHPKLRQSGWTRHYMTHEYCADCDAEMLADDDEELESLGDNPFGTSDEDDRDEDVPF